MNRYTTVLFDMDGTLIDSGEGVTNSVAYALEKFGIHVTDRRELYRFIGPPLIDSYMEYYGLTREEAERGVKYYREYYSDRGVFENRVYDGIPKTLKALHDAGVRVLTATSKPEFYARQILDKLGLTPYFAFIAGATMDETRVAKSEVIAYALEHVGATDHSRILMVGDRHFDVDGAKEIGVDSAGVLFGYGTEEELLDAGATYLVSHARDLLPIVLGEARAREQKTPGMNDKWLEYAIRIQSIAQAGLQYGKDVFDRERYTALRQIAAEMISEKTDIPVGKVYDLFCNESGYQTPKVDTRAAVFVGGKILLVRENNGKWSLPGGWCDVDQSVSSNAEKEVKEEAGLSVRSEKIIAVEDWRRHNVTNYAYGVVKIFVLCRYEGGQFEANPETTGTAFFGKDELPDALATEKCTKEQILMCFDSYENRMSPTLFD